MYPKAGLREMRSLLFHERSIWVSRCVNGLICVRSHGSRFNRSVLQDYFHTHEPALLRERKVNRFRRKRFWAAGCNDLTVFDQHDKWKDKFGLALHIGIDPFLGLIKWLRVWWSNSNPRLICSYYLDDADERGCKSFA